MKKNYIGKDKVEKSSQFSVTPVTHCNALCQHEIQGYSKNYEYVSFLLLSLLEGNEIRVVGYRRGNYASSET